MSHLMLVAGKGLTYGVVYGIIALVWALAILFCLSYLVQQYHEIMLERSLKKLDQNVARAADRRFFTKMERFNNDFR